MSILSLVPSILGTGFSFFSSNKQQKEVEKARKNAEKLMLEQRQRAEQDHNEAKQRFYADYYGDYMNRDSIKRMMNRFRETYDKNNQIAKNRSVMSGAGDAQVRATMAQNYKNLADTAGSIAAQGDAYKENALNNYTQANQQYQKALDNYTQYKIGSVNRQSENAANQWANFSTLVGNLSDSATSSLLNSGGIISPESGVEVDTGKAPVTPDKEKGKV